LKHALQREFVSPELQRTALAQLYARYQSAAESVSTFLSLSKDAYEGTDLSAAQKRAQALTQFISGMRPEIKDYLLRSQLDGL